MTKSKSKFEIARDAEAQNYSGHTPTQVCWQYGANFGRAYEKAKSEKLLEYLKFVRDYWIAYGFEKSDSVKDIAGLIKTYEDDV